MNNNHAAFWSDSPSPKENRYRITHHKRTKQRVNRQEQREETRNKDFWTWEEILDGRGPWAKPGECSRPKEQPKEEVWTWEDELEGRGPWAQPGEYRRPKEELEAAKAERRRYEEAARRSGWKPERQPQKFLGGGANREYGYAR